MKDPIHHRGKLSKKVVRDARQEELSEEKEATTALLEEKSTESSDHEPKDRYPLRRDPHQGFH